MVRRFLAASILLLLVLQGIPAARAQQQPQPPPATPTTYETGFSDNRLSVPTFPFSTLSSQNGIPTFSGLGAGPIAVDSREVVHTVGTFSDLAPDGIHPRYTLLYKNNIPEARRASGFSDPVILRQVIGHTASETPQPGDSSGMFNPDIVVDKDDTVHVFWMEGITTAIPTGPNVYFGGLTIGGGPRIFHAARTSGTWSAAAQITPDDCPGFNMNNFPNSTFSNILGLTAYDAPLVKVGADGRVYLLVRAQITYDFIVPKSFNYTVYVPGTGYIDVWSYNLPFERSAQTWLLGTPDGNWQVLGQMTDQMTILTDPYHNNLPVDEFTSSSRTFQDFAVGPDGSPIFLWVDYTNTNNPYITVPPVRYSGGVADRTAYTEPTLPLSQAPKMIYDSQGVLHILWATLQPNGTAIVSCRDGLSGALQIQTDMPGLGDPFIDGRDQIHVFLGVGYSVVAYSRLRDASGQLSPTFARSGSFSSDQYPYYYPLTNLSGFWSSQHVVALSKNNRLHLSSGGYLFSEQSVLGVRDEGAMIGAIPRGLVNVTTGNLATRIGLYSASGAGPTQALDLNYNSLEPGEGLAGAAWRLSAEMCVVDSQSSWNGGRMTVVQPDGRRIPFTYQGNFGAYIADVDTGVYARIERQGTADNPEYKLTTKSGDVLWFNSSGRLRQIVDPIGNFMNLTYDDQVVGGVHVSHLIQISDMNGQRNTALVYEGANPQYGSRITQITDPEGGSYLLSYQGRSLSTVTFATGPGAPTYGFEYYPVDDPASGARLGQLSRFKTPRAQSGGYFWACLYTPNGRLSQIQDPSENYLQENASDSTPPTQQAAKLGLRYADGSTTWLTDRRGVQSRFLGDGYRSLVFEVDDAAALAQDPGITPVVRAFDGFGNLVDLQDRWGFRTTYNLDYGNAVPSYVVDNVLSILRPSAQSASQDLVASYTYTTDGLNRVQTATTYATPADGSGPQSRTTSFTYNTAGQLTTVQYPDVMISGIPSQTAVQSHFEYGGPLGQLTRSVNENGHGVSYSQFDGACGLPQSVLADGGSDPRLFAYDLLGNLVKKQEPRGSALNDLPNWTVLSRDGLYRLSSEVDPKGKVTNYAYDVDSNLIQVTPPVGAATLTTYDRRGFVSGGSTPDGSYSQWVDAAGNVRRAQDLRGFISNRYFDFMGRTTEVHTPGASTLGAGGGGGDPIEQTTYIYDGFDGAKHMSFMTQKGAPNDRVTRTEYDNRGRAARVVEPDLITNHKTFYDELDHVVAQQKAFGNEIEHCIVTFLDARDRAYQVRRQDGAYGGTSTRTSSTYTLYDPAGNVAQTVDALGQFNQPGYAHKKTYLYDVRERLQFEIDGKGVMVRANFYGDDDRIVETRTPDPASKSSLLVTQATYTYSTRKERLTVLDRNGKGMSYTYGDLAGQVLTATDAIGQVTKTLYDATTVRVNHVIEAMGSPSENHTHYTWTNGLLTQTTVWNPQSQSYSAMYNRSYDQAGRLERFEGPGVAPEQYFYNAFSEMKQLTAGTKTVATTYNSLGQAVQKTWTGAYTAQHTMTYNGAGYLQTIQDGNLGRSTSYETWKGAPLDEVFQVAGANWKIQSHSVDNAGNYVGLSDPEAKLHEWPVDENNRPTQKRYNSNTVSTMTYTPGGLLDQEVIQNASGSPIATTTHTYDGLGNRARSQTVAGNGQVLSEYTWDYNARHDISAIHVNHLGTDYAIGVDDRGRVASVNTPGNQGVQAQLPPITVQYGGPAVGQESVPCTPIVATAKGMLAVPPRSASYTYGPGGHRVSQIADGVSTTYTYNLANQLVTETATNQQVSQTPTNKTVQHTYDEWGNETSRVTTATTQMPTGPVTTTTTEGYGYNHLNLMSTYSNSTTGALWQYDYYPTGERYGKTNLNTNGGEVYVPRFGDVVTEYDRVGSTSNIQITPKNTYVQGTGTDSKSTRISATQDRRHFLSDQVGTVGMTLDDTGSPADVSVKDPWGVQLAGGTSERYGAVAQRETDTESGLVYVRNRMYDPNLGRFTQGEPIVDRRSSAHYMYALNSPATRVDPQGLQDAGVVHPSNDWRNPFMPSSPEPIGPLEPNWKLGSGSLNHSKHQFSIALADSEDGEKARREIYQDLKKFTYFNGGQNKVGRVSIANGVAYFESLGFFGVLSDIINPKKVPVRLSYQESSFQVSGTTLGNHMLAGERRWGVKLTKAKEGEWLTDGLVQAKTVITVWTESYDRPNGALNRGGMTMLGADSQLEVWEGYMRNMELAFMMRYKVKGWRGLIGDKHGLDDDNIRGSQQDLGDQPNPWQPRP